MLVQLIDQCHNLSNLIIKPNESFGFLFFLYPFCMVWARILVFLLSAFYECQNLLLFDGCRSQVVGFSQDRFYSTTTMSSLALSSRTNLSHIRSSSLNIWQQICSFYSLIFGIKSLIVELYFAWNGPFPQDRIISNRHDAFVLFVFLIPFSSFPSKNFINQFTNKLSTNLCSYWS